MKEFIDCRNPVLPTHLHIPDPEAHVMPDGRVYVYGSWDQFDGDIYCSKAYRVFSSADMLNWTDHGQSFDSSKVDWLKDDQKIKYPKIDFDPDFPTPMRRRNLEQKAADPETSHSDTPPPDLLYAPDAIYRNGIYYLYFCAQDDSEGVAIAERPEGPFHDPERLPCGGIDPAVFIDDDGQAYFYWGQYRASGAKLRDNMVELEEGSIVSRIVTEEDHWFHEGSSMRKRNGIYYFVYACVERGKATALGYSTGLSPLGPFTYRGIIIDNDGCDPQSWNNHGSIEEVNGQWYVFYHRSSRNGKNRRRLCVEPIFFNEDGSIEEVPMTSQGAGSPFGPGELVDAYRACLLRGSIFIAPDADGKERLTGISDGNTALFRYVQWNGTVTLVSVTARGSGDISIFIDEIPDPVGHIKIRNGNAVHAFMNGVKGRHEVRLEFDVSDNLELYSLSFN